jgi:post-GPI attachment to proteins factor 3
MIILVTLLLIVIIVFSQINIIFASYGDKSDYFRECLTKTINYNCSLIRVENEFNLNQPLYLRLLGWNCIEESKYECMWKTVDFFVTKLDLEVPQFYGKWPFIRILGIQEPASVLASILHFIVNLYYIRQLLIRTSKYSYMKYLWIGFGLVSLNTWLWSIIFHTRDFPFTEVRVSFKFNSNQFYYL